jgi:hypothetical protein
MKVEIFHGTWGITSYKLQEAINAFLARLPDNAVKHVQTTLTASRSSSTDQTEEDYIISIWYEGEPEALSLRKD